MPAHGPQSHRWGITRKKIEALELGQSVVISKAERNNALGSIQRCAERYEYHRQFRITKLPKGSRVLRVR